jgi:4-hydroxy-3-polyprenylbenzoate decarboxylase
MKPCLTLRELLDAVERDGDLVRVPDEVDLHFEVSAIARAASDAGNPAVLIERPKGAEMPIAVNVYGTRRRIALALGSDERSMIADNQEKLRRPVEPLQVEPAEGALEGRVVLRDEEVDLDRLPIPFWNEGDGGPFITAGVVLAHSHDGPNAGIYRLQRHDSRTLGMYMAPDHHVRRVLERPDRTEPVEACVSIGAPPALYIAGSSDFGAKESEAAIASNLQETPIRWAEGVSVSVPWPVETEIVLEGTLDGELREEGPFVEFTGCRTGSGPSPVFRVTAMHYRPDAIFHAAFVGRPPNETATVWRELEEAEALRLLQARYPIVLGLHRPPDIGRDFVCVIQVDSSRAKPGMIRNLLLGAAYCVPRPKYVIAVDADCDIYRLENVLWALSMWVHPQLDISVVPDTMTSPLDPRGPNPPLTAKMLIDATKKPDAPGVESGPPEAAVAQARELLESLRRTAS